jgi:hypothetical protein
MLHMASYPRDFARPMDQGGPGQGQLVGGFGGSPAVDQQAHRAAVQRVGKAPVLLVHGNGGEAATAPWDLLDLKRMLLAAGYAEELIWAPSYLGAGTLDLLTPHVNNVSDLRDYIESVCGYLEVHVVDIVAHSLGCSLAYAVCRGLEKRLVPVNWNQPKRWHRVGALVALAGAFHGLGRGSIGEWRTGGEFMNELLDEDLGGGGENPFGPGKDETPPPAPHNITYFCGVAKGDFIDAQSPGTGRLAGAINREYNLGAGAAGHEQIKESPVVFNDFLRHLNSVPPAPASKLTADKDTGSHSAPLQITVTSAPDRAVEATANRITRVFLAGFITDKVSETQRAILGNGQSITLASSGMWQLTLHVDGATDDLIRTYWIGVPAVNTTITTESAPFQHSLLVVAATSEPTASVYHSLDGTLWNLGATVTILQDAVVSFVAITPVGLASEVVSRSFTRAVGEGAVTASANGHFIAGRIGVGEYLSYAGQFGFFTPFTLYLVDGDWILAPDRALLATLPPGLAAVRDPRARDDRARRVAGMPNDQLPEGLRVVRVKEGDPEPGRHSGPVSITLEASYDTDDQVVVSYSRDGSIPDEDSPWFVGRAHFEVAEEGNHLITCCVTGPDGIRSYQSFGYSIGR